MPTGIGSDRVKFSEGRSRRVWKLKWMSRDDLAFLLVLLLVMRYSCCRRCAAGVPGNGNWLLQVRFGRSDEPVTMN